MTEPYKPKQPNSHPWKRAWSKKRAAEDQKEKREKLKKELER